VPILGIVLAGGAARRFGSDKALALIDGRPLIEHAIAALAPVVDRIAISGRTYKDYSGLPDRPEPGLGPLGGLNAALHHAADHGFAGVLSVPCDVPAYPPGLLTQLASRSDAAILGGLPVCGYWPSALAPLLDRHLQQEGSLSVRRWAGLVGAVSIETSEALPNINTQADMMELDPGYRDG
jgi:molybdopterin-guanine dinucleotide biosynthesis protein A